jgi:nitrite reductase/ring-hydroxylating ferredoxin subunit
MFATTQLGSFIVNLGRLEKIPRGEERVFRVGGTPIVVFHSREGNVLATENLKTYPVKVNEEGEVLVGIDSVLAAR